MDFGVATSTRGALRQSRGLCRRRRGGRAAGLRLHQRQRSRRRAARHRLALPLQRIGRVGGAHRRRMPGPARHAGVSGGPHRAAAAADLGDGGAAAPSRADRQDAGDHRRAVRRPADRRLRRRLAEGGVRGARRPALRRARARHRRVPRRLQGALDRGRAQVCAASTSASTTSSSRPSRCTKPHPPIWIGGESPQALKRTVRVGDGWYPASNNPQHRLDTPERLGAASASCGASPRPRAAIPAPSTSAISCSGRSIGPRRRRPTARAASSPAARRTWRPTWPRWSRPACATSA